MAKVMVYNGYADLRMLFDGRVYAFPYKKTTAVDDVYSSAPDLWRRNHESDPRPNAMLEREYPAEEFVQTLFTRHGQNLIAQGVVWIGDREPSEPQKNKVNENGRRLKMKQVEESMTARKQALAKGGNPELDPQIVTWMMEYHIHDPLYNPEPRENVLESIRSVMEKANAMPTLDAMKPLEERPVQIGG